jgi:hypothetical protein
MGYLMAGAMAGLGQGLKDVGGLSAKEQLQMDHDRTILKLQGEEREKLQTLQQQFEAGQHGIDYSHQIALLDKKLAAGSAAAGATREFESGENTKNRAASQTRSETSANARVDSAYLSSLRGSSGGKAGGVKALQSVTLNIIPQHATGKTNADGSPEMVPIPNALPEQHRLTYDPNTGIHWVQIGDKFHRADAKGNPVLDPAALNRAPPNPSDIRGLLANPYAIVPSAYKNAGMTYAESFEKEHGYLPGEYLNTVNKLAAAAQKPTSVRLPGSGRTIMMPQSGGDSGQENPQQESSDESEGPSNFQSGANAAFSDASE